MRQRMSARIKRQTLAEFEKYIKTFVFGSYLLRAGRSSHLKLSRNPSGLTTDLLSVS